jgi:phospholipase/carboxylesterase
LNAAAPKIVEAAGTARGDVVLLHGFGSSAADLAPFARSINVEWRFVVPDAPVDLAPYGVPGRGWWPVDVDSRDREIAAGTPRDLSYSRPEGLADARLAVEGQLDALASGGPRPLVLGGFSQGAMLACDLALRTERPLAALVLLSGARMCADEWAALYARRRGLRVFMSHGRNDPDLSFTAAENLGRLLRDAGLEVEFHAWDAGHEAPLQAWRELKKFLRALS